MDPSTYEAAAVVLLLIYVLVPAACLAAALLTARGGEERRREAEKAAHAEARGRARGGLGGTGGADDMQALLTFQNIRWSVQVKHGKVTQTKQIIKGVTGFFEVRPKTLTAIMGPSGCGKSTLLDILADRKAGAPATGEIMVNGQPRGPSYRRQAAYVMQSDVLFPRLTVRETILYAAHLRVSKEIPEATKQQRVDEILEDLELVHVADTLIGDETLRGLSGGQKRRVTVAVELVTDPSILFLDEPTSGLVRGATVRRYRDAYNSLKLVKVLRRLANAGRVVVCTIHQPRPDIFNLFDNLLLMKAGQIVYLGPAESKAAQWTPGNLRDYFAAVGRPIAADQDVADVVVDLTSQKEEGDDDEPWLVVDVDEFDDVDPVSTQKMEGASAAVDDGEGVIVDIVPNAGPPVHFAVEQARTQTAYRDPLLRAWEGSKWKAALDTYMDGLTSQAKRDLALAQLQGESPAAMRRYANGYVEQTAELLRRSFLNLQRQKDRLLQSYLINIGNFLFLGIFFLGLRVPPYNQQSELVILKGNTAFIFLVTQHAILSELDTIGDVFLEKNVFLRESAGLSYSPVAYHSAWLIKLFSYALLKGLPYTVVCYFLSGMTINAADLFYFAAVMTLLSTIGSAIALLLVSLVPSLEGSAATYSSVIGLFETTAGFYLKPGLIPYWDTPLYFLSPVTYVLQGIYWTQFYGLTLTLEYLQVMPNANQWANLIIMMAYAPFLHFCAFAATVLITQRTETRTRLSRWFQERRRHHLENQIRISRAVRRYVW